MLATLPPAPRGGKEMIELGRRLSLDAIDNVLASTDNNGFPLS